MFGPRTEECVGVLADSVRTDGIGPVAVCHSHWTVKEEQQNIVFKIDFKDNWTMQTSKTITFKVITIGAICGT